MQSRTWARGLEQGDFEREYQRRFPFGDVIPNVDEYINGSDPTYNGIPDLPPEPYTQDGPAEEPLKNRPKFTYPCRGCGKSFDFAIARAGHERSCKVKLQKEKVHA